MIEPGPAAREGRAAFKQSPAEATGQASALEREWAKYRKKIGLDLYGKAQRTEAAHIGDCGTHMSGTPIRPSEMPYRTFRSSAAAHSRGGAIGLSAKTTL